MGVSSPYGPAAPQDIDPEYWSAERAAERRRQRIRADLAHATEKLHGPRRTAIRRGYWRRQVAKLTAELMEAS